MPYEVECEDGMKIQVSSLNRLHDWPDYCEKFTQAARKARRATPEHDYAIVLVIKAD